MMATCQDIGASVKEIPTGYTWDNLSIEIIFIIKDCKLLKDKRHIKNLRVYLNKISFELGNTKLKLVKSTPDILECEVKWALESITMDKASGGDGIPVELFQTLKDDAVKVLHTICQQIWETQQWPQDWKRSVFIAIPKKGNAKEGTNYCTIALISRISKAQNSPSQASAICEP